ncbi:TonB-dependent receptor [Alkaliflexus imshenetskii]|nr:TonB-dependent receptor [Alkaliflexus imshenetskii]
MRVDYLIMLVFLLWLPFFTFAGELPTMDRLPVVSGYIRDARTGETLIGATLHIRDTNRGAVSNPYGFYSLAVNRGEVIMMFTFLGYEPVEKRLTVTSDLSMNIELEPVTSQISEVRIVGNNTQTRLDDPLMGVQKIHAATIKEIPAFMGEVDPIKVIQLMPGVQAASEGSSGFSVRGGNPDQNLVLLDEAIVYNAGHLMGFFSVFNNDAIKEVNLYKGDIPARSGGRLASLLDVRMKDGNSRKFSGTGGIGSISSRLTLEGPVFSEKTTFLASGRRTYADLFLPFSSDEAVRDNKLYFYDFNAKLNHTFSDYDRIFVSGYFGRDVFDNTYSRMEFGNKTLSVRWNHVYSPRLFSNVSFNFSNYDYLLGTNEEHTDGFRWAANMEDTGLKADFNYYPNASHSITFGAQTLFHNIMPGHVRGTGSTSMYNELRLPRNLSYEHAVYAENTQKIGSRVSLRYGMRFSLFQNVGKGTSYRFDDDYKVTDTLTYKKGDVFNTYYGFEPRAGFTYLINQKTSFKASYSRTYQYMQMASNSTGTMPLDIWFSASPNVKPQLSDQVSAGFFRHFLDGAFDVGVEAFYKNMDNAVDFKDYAELLLNERLEGELRFGRGYAYGLEFLTRFNYGRWNGWVGYTYSRSKRQADGINNDNWYLSPYDHPHDCSIVIMHNLSQRVSFAANWVYFSGSPATFPVGRFESGGSIIPIYSQRNAERLPDYHRMDLSVTLRNRERPERKWQGEWVFSTYNTYGRKNAWVINFEKQENEQYATRAMKTYLFSIVPAVTYNFKF